MKIVTVIPLKKGLWKEDLTYFTAKEIQKGSIVTIPIRNKEVLGLVIDSEDLSEAKSDIKDLSFNLKKVSDVKEESIWRTEYLESILEISKYFLTNKSNVFSSLIPSIFIENYDKISKFKNESGKIETIDQNTKKIRVEKLLLQLPLEDRISIYKTLIRENFALKKSIFIVLPTENDIRTFSESLSKGIEQFTFSLHGGLTPKKTNIIIEKIITSSHPALIIATAPFLSIPRYDLGVIILEQENSATYKLITRPHLDLRIFVELYSAKINTKLILGDTLLRFETIARKDADNLNPMHPLSFRIDFDGEIKIIGKDTEQKSEFKILSDEILTEIANKIERKKNVFIFSLRKGLATMTICRDCNNTVSCEKCGAPVVLYNSKDGKKRMFICNKCKEEKDNNTHCSYCESWNLMPLGIGTDTVYEEIKRNFPKTKILKLDKEVAKNAKGAEQIIKEYEENEGSILIGTEMAFFYMKNQVPLSIISSFDSLWSIPNFKMSEKIIGLVLSIIERTTEKLIIQTKNDTDSAILAIKNGNLLSFVREEIQDRKNLNYPPFKRFIKITHTGDKNKILEIKEIFRRIFAEYNPEIFSGFHSKTKDQYLTNMLLKIDPEKWSLPEISLGSNIDEELYKKINSLPIFFDIYVDPEDLL